MDNVIELEVGEGRQEGTYALRVLRSVSGGEPTGTLVLDIDELLAQRPLIEATVLASAVAARRATSVAEQPVRTMGQQLFEKVFSGPIGGAYRASLGVARERGEGLQVVLRLTAPGLAALPWETLYDPEIEAYVCRKEPLVRHVPGQFTPEALAVQPPLRILGMVASPRGLPVLDVQAEQDRLREALSAHIDAGRVELVWLDDVSWAGVHAKLLQESWHILHFIGHGGYDMVTDEGVLALVGPDLRADYVGASSFADLLDEAEPTPRLVVLNSCASGATGAEDLFSGTAAALVRSGIHAVAAMQFAVSDGAAIAFARGFYTAIASGRGIDDAVRSGRIGILGTHRGTLEWVTPVMYLRGGGTQLFAVAPDLDKTVLPEVRKPDSGDEVASARPAAATGWGSGERPPAPDAARIARPDPALQPPHPPEISPAVGPGTGKGTRRRLIIGGATILTVAGAVAAAIAIWSDANHISGSAGAAGSGSVVTTMKTAIPATQVWTDTGVGCTAGDVLGITVLGTVRHEDSATGEVGPEGLTDPFFHQWNVPGLPDANTVAAIGSLDQESPFVVGSGTTYTCDRDGELYLGVNDIGVANNSGEFNATITRIASP
ncbi:MAG: CHAT domain-containing protein [Cellulomonas sp.]